MNNKIKEGKNIVIFSDGTGQMGGKDNNTNIYKMFNMIEDRTSHQIVFYDPGLGTDSSIVLGGLYGKGFSKNILDCYRFIFTNYLSGDKIFLFGFSRGAATVRSLANFIDMFGVLPLSREDLIEQAFDIYKIRNEAKRNKKAKEFIGKNHTMWTKIEFLGVFDTVAALGVPNRFLNFFVDIFTPLKFHSFEIKENIIHARHALSIDEKRKLFSPVLFNVNDSTKIVKTNTIKEVWFCGVHTDVGGGYLEHGVSNISLDWMIDEAVSKGLKMFKRNYENYFKACSMDIEGKIHNEQLGIKGKIFKSKERNWDITKNGPPTIHESVLERKKNIQNHDKPSYNSWILQIENKQIEKYNCDKVIFEDEKTHLN